MGDIQSELADLDLEVTDEDVLAQLAVLCQRYAIDAEKISCEYFSFASTTKQTLSGKLLTGPPTMDTLGPFENEKLKNLKPAGARRPLDPIEGAANLPDAPELAEAGTPVRVAAKRQVTPDGHLAKRLVTALGTPGIAASSAPASPALPVGKRYLERTNKGEVVVKHNVEVEGERRQGVKVAVELPAGHLSSTYKFMYERLRDRAAVVDDTITAVGARLVRGLGREEEALLDLTSTHPEVGLAVGRVQCDGEGRLNSNSVVLQGSVEASGGAVVPVELGQAAAYSLFPGQVLALDATNPNGSRLVAHTVHPATALATPAPSGLKEGEVVTVLAACGPFSTSDSCGLEPLEDFLAVVAEERPSLAVIIGPFVDVKNTQVVESEASFEAQWHKVVSRLAEVASGLETQVVVVASARDAHGIPIYPQPPLPSLDPATAALFKEVANLRCVSDPCTFTVGGVVVGVTSTDILFHLGKEEISFPPRSGDRMARLAGHLLSQGSYYPLYPPSEEVSLEHEQLEQHGSIHRPPHLLLLPSDLSHFVREVQGSTVVNPGRVTRGQGPGTWARAALTARGGGVAAAVEVVRI